MSMPSDPSARWKGYYVQSKWATDKPGKAGDCLAESVESCRDPWEDLCVYNHIGRRTECHIQRHVKVI